MKSLVSICALILFGTIRLLGEGWATTTLLTPENISKLDHHAVSFKLLREEVNTRIVVEIELDELTTTVDADVSIRDENSLEHVVLFKPRMETVGKRAEARGVRRFEFMVGNSQLKNVSLLYSLRFPGKVQADGFVLRWPALEKFVVER